MALYGYPMGGSIANGRGSTQAGRALISVQCQESYDATDDTRAKDDEGHDVGFSAKDLWISVPDGTQAGAVSNGDGTWTNPSPRPSV
jgi:GTPase involved in cell partitioning and DNA repair